MTPSIAFAHARLDAAIEALERTAHAADRALRDAPDDAADLAADLNDAARNLSRARRAYRSLAS